MGKRLKIKNGSGAFNDQNLTDLGNSARAEIERLLALRPQYKAFQEEIDARLNAAGGIENRLAVLGIMLEAKLGELKQQLMLLDWMIDGNFHHKN